MDVNLIDDIKAKVIDLITSSCDDAECFDELMAIGNNLESLRIRIRDLEEDVRDYRRRAIKAEMDLKRANEKLEALVTEE